MTAGFISEGYEIVNAVTFKLPIKPRIFSVD